MRKLTDDEIIQRSFSKIQISEKGCWIWTGIKQGSGKLYGRVKHNVSAHRFFYEFYNGKIPQGMNVCHRCDDPTCCNPNHLFLGTQKENVHDAMSKGRLPRGLTHGMAVLTEEKVLAIRNDPRPQRAIARDYNLAQSHVWRIKHGLSWRHLSV